MQHFTVMKGQLSSINSYHMAGKQVTLTTWESWMDQWSQHVEQ
jgi:hypothetical protein